jgi:hypothetical protein
MTSPKLQARPLPCITDCPKREWRIGWWQGYSVGAVSMAAVVTMAWLSIKAAL